jgi:hypothetical protein
MHLSLIQFIGSSILLCLSLAQGLVAQDDIPVEPLSPIEDATLDGSSEPSVESSTTPSDSVPLTGTAPGESGSQSETVSADEVSENSEPEVTPPSEDRQQSPPDSSAVTNDGGNAGSSDFRAVKQDVVESDQPVVGTYGGRVFGRYKMQLSGNKPTFDIKKNCFDKFYGSPEPYFSLSGDWFPADWWVNPGITMRIGSLTARGRTVKGTVRQSETTSCDQLQVDESSKTTLLFLPIQVGTKIQITPFSRKWLVLDVWAAGELGWWQETRDAETSSETALAGDESKTQKNKVYTSTGRKLGLSTGVSVHLLLNYIDESTVRSMVDSMGIGYVYLTGFAERVSPLSDKGLTFGRQVYGLGFTFETYK